MKCRLVNNLGEPVIYLATSILWLTSLQVASVNWRWALRSSLPAIGAKRRRLTSRELSPALVSILIELRRRAHSYLLSVMTSLNMPGLSISLVKLPSKPATVQGYSISANHLIDLFDAQSAVPSWKNSPKAEPNQAILSGNDGQAKANAQSNAVHKGPTPDSKVFLSAVTEACKSVIEAEPYVSSS